MRWIGERSRQMDGAHVEFLRGVGNPIGCWIGPTVTADDVLILCERSSPDRVPGRLTLVSRMGAGTIATSLPPLLAAVRDAGYPVVWTSDPMHGNTFTSDTGRKTRDFDALLAEIAGPFAAHWAEDIWPGGVHIERPAAQRPPVNRSGLPGRGAARPPLSRLHRLVGGPPHA